MPENDHEHRPGLSRKHFMMAVGLGAAAVPAIAAAAPASAQTTRQTRLRPTPSCDDGDDPTPPQTEGPYFTPGSPEREDITSGAPGTALTVSGIVYTMSCEPVSRALLDFWQCDTYGRYDNVGYTLRGHQYTGADGAFNLVTIWPGLYPGRTRHIHVKVQAPNRPVLTTQLYFPNEPRNRTDPIFHPDLLMDIQDGPSGRTGTFDFVLRIP